MKALLLPITFAVWTATATAAAFPVTNVQQAGPSTQRFNVAILGDGYRAADQAKLTSDAKALVNALFVDTPYKPYRQLFNFKVIQSVSVDQGAKGGSVGGTPNTLFSAYYNCEGVSQLVCIDSGAVLAAAAADVPEFDLAVVVVNDDLYGGSGGSVPVVSTNSGASEILRHELGHNLANLADEYQSAYPGYPACSASKDCSEPNVTMRSARAQIKWLDWILDSTPVPTAAGKGFAGVGLFEGARYMSTGFYRPVDTACKMQSLGQPFCPVCAEALVRSFWNLANVHLIDEAVPATDVVSSKCVAETFSVKTPAIAPSTLNFAWSVDDQLQTETGASLELAAGEVAAGPHSIVVTVNDSTQLVRSDPDGVLTETHTFKYTAPPCKADAGAGGGGAGNGGNAGNAGASVTEVGSAGSAGTPSAGMSAGGTGGDSVSSAGSGNSGPTGTAPPPAERIGCNCRMTERTGSGRPLFFVALLGAAGVMRRRRSVSRRQRG